MEEYEDHEIRSLVEVATAPAPRPSEELPKLMRGGLLQGGGLAIQTHKYGGGEAGQMMDFFFLSFVRFLLRRVLVQWKNLGWWICTALKLSYPLFFWRKCSEQSPSLNAAHFRYSIEVGNLHPQNVQQYAQNGRWTIAIHLNFCLGTDVDGSDLRTQFDSYHPYVDNRFCKVE